MHTCIEREIITLHKRREGDRFQARSVEEYCRCETAGIINHTDSRNARLPVPGSHSGQEYSSLAAPTLLVEQPRYIGNAHTDSTLPSSLKPSCSILHFLVLLLRLAERLTAYRRRDEKRTARSRFCDRREITRIHAARIIPKGGTEAGGSVTRAEQNRFPRDDTFHFSDGIIPTSPTFHGDITFSPLLSFSFSLLRFFLYFLPFPFFHRRIPSRGKR